MCVCSRRGQLALLSTGYSEEEGQREKRGAEEHSDMPWESLRGRFGGQVGLPGEESERDRDKGGRRAVKKGSNPH
uniref:Uncharacterized protein n=1 Tax=Knipowitschia caucasica TaxID=637954 RepID=A0AAV2MQT1_KNICA